MIIDIIIIIIKCGRNISRPYYCTNNEEYSYVIYTCVFWLLKMGSDYVRWWETIWQDNSKMKKNYTIFTDLNWLGSQLCFVLLYYRDWLVAMSDKLKKSGKIERGRLSYNSYYSSVRDVSCWVCLLYCYYCFS